MKSIIICLVVLFVACKVSAKTEVGQAGVIASPSHVAPANAGIVTPVAPYFLDAETVNAYGCVIMPHYSDTIIYRLNGEICEAEQFVPVGTAVTVTATPVEGYEFPEDTVTTWTHTIRYVGPRPPVFIDANNRFIVIIPSPGTGQVTYSINTDEAYEGEYYFSYGDTVTVTVEPANGDYFSANTVTSWTHTFGSGTSP
ncbi:InlB B-repeat-containing protein [Ereboglobus luteus]|uniref:Bacterial repeat domain-containing protein n=1 Tax=Ereboglobus luteus TaxID=1796921 RepID=A0A2U8E3B3_9BACT|nr:hypothetical protein [Ereboglobus luteus]AWI09300.1 hypothetical protein CKA38_08640 [Ereboglobus luteus]